MEKKLVNNKGKGKGERNNSRNGSELGGGARKQMQGTRMRKAARPWREEQPAGGLPILCGSMVVPIHNSHKAYEYHYHQMTISI